MSFLEQKAVLWGSTPFILKINQSVKFSGSKQSVSHLFNWINNCHINSLSVILPMSGFSASTTSLAAAGSVESSRQ